MVDEQDHVITDAEKENWQRGKNRKRAKPEDLTRSQKLLFVQLVARDSNSGVFERKLNLSRRDVNYFKTQYDILTTEDARRLLRKLQVEEERREEEELSRERKNAAEAQRVAQAKLEELEKSKEQKREESRQRRAEEMAAKKGEFKKEDAKRQREFAEEQDKAKVETEWRLPITSRDGEEEKIRFSNDISYRGLKFTKQKYGITEADIRSEAARLGLRIRWDLVRP